MHLKVVKSKSTPVAADFSLRSVATYEAAATIAIIGKILDW